MVTVPSVLNEVASPKGIEREEVWCVAIKAVRGLLRKWKVPTTEWHDITMDSVTVALSGKFSKDTTYKTVVFRAFYRRMRKWMNEQKHLRTLRSVRPAHNGLVSRQKNRGGFSQDL